jgi:hypothetical protein
MSFFDADGKRYFPFGQGSGMDCRRALFQSANKLCSVRVMRVAPLLRPLLARRLLFCPWLAAPPGSFSAAAVRPVCYPSPQASASSASLACPTWCASRSCPTCRRRATAGGPWWWSSRRGPQRRPSWSWGRRWCARWAHRAQRCGQALMRRPPADGSCLLELPVVCRGFGSAQRVS